VKVEGPDGQKNEMPAEESACLLEHRYGEPLFERFRYSVRVYEFARSAAILGRFAHETYLPCVAQSAAPKILME
jgi:hypothetical protein